MREGGESPPYARAGEISGDVRTRRAATHRWRQMEQKEGEWGEKNKAVRGQKRGGERERNGMGC